MVRNVTSNNDFPIARKFGRHLATLDERLNDTMALYQSILRDLLLVSLKKVNIHSHQY